jgi:hypothetical protein
VGGRILRRCHYLKKKFPKEVARIEMVRETLKLTRAEIMKMIQN